jgi:hypothetical protein
MVLDILGPALRLNFRHVGMGRGNMLEERIPWKAHRG